MIVKLHLERHIDPTSGVVILETRLELIGHTLF